MTYKGKAVIRLIGKVRGGIGSMCVWFAGGGCQKFKIYYEQWTEVDGGWIIQPLGGSTENVLYIKRNRPQEAGRNIHARTAS